MPADIDANVRVRMLELLLELKGQANRIKDHEKWIRVNTAISAVAREIQSDPQDDGRRSCTD